MHGKERIDMMLWGLPGAGGKRFSAFRAPFPHLILACRDFGKRLQLILGLAFFPFPTDCLHRKH